MRALDVAIGPEQALPALRRRGEPAVFCDGRGGHDGAWPCRMAIRPRVVARAAGDAGAALRETAAAVARRRLEGGPGGTGIAMALAYEGLRGAHAPRPEPWSLIALAADASLTFREGEPVVAAGARRLVEEAERLLEAPRAEPQPPSAVRSPRPATSLPRSDYLHAVRRIKEHIARGDIYQGNLTQRFACHFPGDPWGLYVALAAATPAPRSAFLEAEGLGLASVSPEVFVDVDAAGRARTWPIKGTRARETDAARDASAAAELLASEKDRAELVMIVDLERNDLGRVARTGTVRVPELLALRSYAAVHHLVARVEADLRDGVGPDELVRAIFPGGSITGAPKERAIEILADVEPVPRGLYTGSLFWFDDDGSTLSSILIRSAVVHGGRATVGAGGGIVADSDPEAEWAESNAKARALTRVLGFEPEEAS